MYSFSLNFLSWDFFLFAFYLLNFGEDFFPFWIETVMALGTILPNFPWQKMRIDEYTGFPQSLHINPPFRNAKFRAFTLALCNITLVGSLLLFFWRAWEIWIFLKRKLEKKPFSVPQIFSLALCDTNCDTFDTENKRKSFYNKSFAETPQEVHFLLMFLLKSCIFAGSIYFNFPRTLSNFIRTQSFRAVKVYWNLESRFL